MGKRGIQLSLLSTAIAAAIGCGAPSDSAESDGADQALASSASLVAGIERRRAAVAGGDDDAATQRASVHFGNAYWLAQLSVAAYHPDDASLKSAVGALGIPASSVTTFVNSCTKAVALYAKVGGAAVLAFRGTQPDIWETVAVDAVSLKTLWEGVGMVHSGFLAQFLSVWNAAPSCGVPEGIGSFVAARHRVGPNGEPVGGELYFTGHSLGAALATLALAQTYADVCGMDPLCGAAPKIPVSALYTFGSPRTGSEIFAWSTADHARGRTSIFRFVYRNDLVTGIPFNLLPTDPIEYAHLSYLGLSEDTFQVWMDGPELVISSYAPHTTTSVDDHGPGTYPPNIALHARARHELR